MVRKKSISDVLRKETQQPVTPESPASPKAEQSGDNTPLVPLQMPTTASTATPSAQPGEDLSAKVEELKKSLQAAESSEQKLKKQLQEAQAKLKEQTELNKKLAADVAKIDQLTKELEEAKATILQLVEAKKEQPTKSSALQPSLPRYPIKPSQPPTRSRTTDVGWMD
jgi:predicted RNase H-like nuclease (RuvC/YqgF family)